MGGLVAIAPRCPVEEVVGMDRIVRQALTIVGGLLGLGIMFQNLSLLNGMPILHALGSNREGFILAVGLVLGGFLGFFLGPWLVRWASRAIAWGESRLQRTPTQDLLSGTMGLIAGLVVAFLLGVDLSGLGPIGTILRVAITIGFGYIGLRVMVRRKDEIMRPQSWLPSRMKHRPASPDASKPKILDTSVIIDGRIADICETGFLEGPLVIPAFVLEELRHIADSADVLKRNRGRRGLDILNRIKKSCRPMCRFTSGMWILAWKSIPNF